MSEEDTDVRGCREKVRLCQLYFIFYFFNWPTFIMIDMRRRAELSAILLKVSVKLNDSTVQKHMKNHTARWKGRRRSTIRRVTAALPGDRWRNWFAKKKSICSPPHYYIVTFTRTFSDVGSKAHDWWGWSGAGTPIIFHFVFFLLKSITHSFRDSFNIGSNEINAQLVNALSHVFTHRRFNLTDQLKKNNNVLCKN